MKSKRAHAQKIMSMLKKAYPHVPSTFLAHKTTYQLLVATVLSAQCTDERVNKVTSELFRKYSKPPDFASANQRELESLIRSTGFYKAKAKNIKNAAKDIVEKFDGRVPKTMDGLTSLPGVGRKTANIILTAAYGMAVGIAVDTHVERLSKRMGLSAGRNPEAIEKDLMSLYPKTVWGDINKVFITHGRIVCKAKNPGCGDCIISRICPQKGVKPTSK